MSAWKPYADAQYQAVSSSPEDPSPLPPPQDSGRPRYMNFAETVRFIAAAESARNHDNLTLPDLADHLLDGLVKKLRRQIRR